MGFDVDDFLNSTYHAVPHLVSGCFIRMRDQVWTIWRNARTMAEIVAGRKAEATATVVGEDHDVPEPPRPLLTATGFYFLTLCVVLILPVLITGVSPLTRATGPVSASSGTSLVDRAISALWLGREGDTVLALALAGIAGLLIQAIANFILRWTFTVDHRETVHDALLLQGGAQLVVFFAVEVLAFIPMRDIGFEAITTMIIIAASYILIVMPIPLAWKMRLIARPALKKRYFAPLFIAGVDLSLVAVICGSTLVYYELTQTGHAYLLTIDRCKVEPTPEALSSISAVVIVRNTAGHAVVLYGDELQLSLAGNHSLSDGPGTDPVLAKPTNVTMQAEDGAAFPKAIDTDQSALFMLQAPASQEMKDLATSHWNENVGNLWCKVTSVVDPGIEAKKQAVP